ncbi:hypothetical protein ASE03_25135 [Kitasatospora sp. Root187]|nr:hypothetical protein ASC99_22305 [Kitasatospora sp. Root107]KRB70726.1 hypothetical protein ASE03_25135 [Kitasatospora sp. Root187]
MRLYRTEFTSAGSQPKSASTVIGARPLYGARVCESVGTGVPPPGSEDGEDVDSGLFENVGSALAEWLATGLGDPGCAGPTACLPPPGSVSESVAATTTATPAAATAPRRRRRSRASPSRCA